MDRLGFVRTFEAILSAVIVLSLYTFIQTQNYNQVQIIRRTPVNKITDFIESVSINDIINDYDYGKLSRLINNLMSRDIQYYIEAVYYEKFSIKSSEYLTSPNISITYNFPKGIDKNSIRIINDDYELPTNALFNHYYNQIIFNQPVINSYIKINATLDRGDINNKSLRLFINNKESIISIKEWTQGTDHTNTTLIIYIPEIKANEEAMIYFSTGNYLNITYPEITEDQELNVTVQKTQQANTAQIIFTPENITTNWEDYHVKYSLFTNEQNNYAGLTQSSNQEITIIASNELKTGTSPYTTGIKRGEAIKK